MQRNINSLMGYTVGATDGEIGKVEDFYFDDKTWTLRYMVMKSGNWFSGREMLISTYALIKNLWDTGTFLVNLTKEQVRNSPDINTDQPVSRQQEIELHGYYAWQNYWDGGYYAGGLSAIADPYVATAQKRLNEQGSNGKQSAYDQHLRSTHKVTGYHIHATDGEIGHVKDFVIDNKTWQIVYLVVNTHNWFGGKEVLIPVTHVTEVEWDNSKVYVDVTVDSVKNSIAFDNSVFNHSGEGHSFYLDHTIHAV